MAVPVYVLWSEAVKRFYVGISKYTKKRLRQHNRGMSQWIRNKGPWMEVLTENYDDYDTARQREKHLKSGAGREWLRAVLVKK